MTKVIDLAHDLAARGLPVFPCAPNKRPTCPRGFHAASTDPDMVDELWRKHSGPLIGVPTGEASGFDALDIDPAKGGEIWWNANQHRIPETRMHRTRSGGLHILFRHHAKVRNSESSTAPGVDVRGEGGYIVWWPAHGTDVARASLVPWPLWLVRRLLKKPAAATTKTRQHAPIVGSDAVERIAARVIQRVADAHDGQRHITLRKASYTIGGLLDRLPFGKTEAAERLVEAVKQAGAVDLANAKRTAEWGLARGASAPLTGERR